MDSDSGRVIFRRSLPRGRCRKDFQRGRHTGNVSARGNADTVFSLTDCVGVLYLCAYFRKAYESVDDESVESARKKRSV